MGVNQVLSGTLGVTGLLTATTITASGMITANGKIFMTTLNGHVLCFDLENSSELMCLYNRCRPQ
jgi:outer membrane protein assembly factor BamB